MSALDTLDTAPTGRALTTYLEVRVVVRALIAAAVIGSALTTLNQTGAVFGSDPFKPLPTALVFVIPFLTVTLSQLLGARAAQNTAGPGETFARTLLSHGIPRRAILLGLAMGSLSVITLSAFGPSGPLPTAFIGQAMTLPMFFSALSQSLAYRRAVSRAV